MTHKRWLVICLITTVVLMGCTSPASPTSTVTPVVTAPPTTTGPSFRPAGVVVASGVVAPARFARMGHTSPIAIEAVEVELGDAVKKGQILIRFQGQAALDMAIAAAEFELLEAQRALDAVYEGADVVTAQVAMALAVAQDDLKDANYKRTVRQEGNRASGDTIDAANASLVLAEDKVDRAEGNFNAVSGRPADDPARALALSNLVAARQERDAALRNLNWYTGHPSEIEQALLDAEVALAEAQLAQVKMEWERVKNGPDPVVQAAAEARLKLAEAQLTSAQEASQNGLILAPFDGIVAELSATPGEIAVPGQALVVVADLEHLQVETTDLSERDVHRVSVGSPAEVFIEPLGIYVPGHVTRIASSASIIGGDVVYAVTLDLDEQPVGLLWGMSVEVEIEVE